MTPDQISIAVCFLIAVVSYSLGRLLMGRSQNEPHRRSLAFGALTHVLAVLIPVMFETKAALKRDLVRAGYYHRYALSEYLAVRNALVIGWVGLTCLIYWSVTLRNPDLKFPIAFIGTIVAVMFYAVPRLLLHAQASGRMQRIQHALPDAMDMITMSMTGGLPLVQALEHVSRELDTTHPDLGCELTIVRRQMEAGSLDQALQQFAARVDIADVQSLAALIGQTERLGANIGAAFHEYSDSIRRSLRQSAEERGNRASVKLLLPIVFCLAPPVYILLLSPALLELRKFVIEQNEPGGVLVQDVEVSLPTAPLRSNSPTTEGG